AKVPQKAVTHIGALHYVTGKHRKISSWVIATTAMKLGNHLIGPVLHTGFPAIHRHVLQRGAGQITEMLLDRIHVATEVGLHILRAELVDFITKAGSSCRTVLCTG